MITRKPKMGSVYRRGRIWWIKYYLHGQAIYESSRSQNPADAERLLKRRQGEIAIGKFAGLRAERVRVSELLADLLEDYRIREIKGLAKSECRIRKNLVPFFGNLRAAELESVHLKRYIAERRRKGAANATINRELELLGRAFRLAYKSDPPKVARVPVITRLPEDNVRTGMLDHAGYLRLRDALPPHYRLLLVLGYCTGARLGELLSIRWDDVDSDRGEIRLQASNTKTGKPRIIPVYGEMKHWLDMARAERDAEFPGCPWVFQVKGQQMIFRWKTWNEYCALAEVPELRFHDLRRTALTNMVRAGIPEKEAMAVSGHTTRRTFERYHIVTDQTLREVGQKMGAYYQQLCEDSGLTVTETVTAGRVLAGKLLN